MLDVRTATFGERQLVSEILAKAFVTDPVVRWMMPKPDRDAQMFQVLATHVHNAHGGAEIAFENGEPVGAALWDPPGHRLSLRHQFAASWGFLRTMRSGARRGARLDSAFRRNRPAGEFWYLAQVGAIVQGHGVGSALLEHRLAHCEGPSYLESSNPANVPLYERFGYEVTAVFDLPEDGPPIYGMLRP